MTTSEPDANHAQIQRIVSRKALKGSELHRNLLTYLADKSLAALANQFVARRKGTDGTLPRYYQAVLKVKAMDREPMDVSYVSHRELALAKHDQAAGGAP